MTVGVISLAVPGSACVRRRVPDPRGRLPARLVVGGDRRRRDRARRDVHAPADLGGPARGARLDGLATRRSTSGRASSRSSSRSSAGLLASRRGRQGSRSHSFAGDSPTAAVREPVQVINTPSVDWFAISTILVLLGASFCRAARRRARAADGARRAFAAAAARSLGFAGGLVTSDLALRRQRRRPHVVAGRLLPRPLDGARAGHPLRHRARHDAPRVEHSPAGAACDAPGATTTSRSSSRSCSPRLRGWRSSSAPRTSWCCSSRSSGSRSRSTSCARSTTTSRARSRRA